MGPDEGRRRKSGLGSTVGFAGRSWDSSSPFSDPIDGDDSFYDHRRSSCRSPRSKTPPRSSPYRYLPRRRGRDDGRCWSPYHDCASRSGMRSGPGDGDSSSEDDEDLKGLSYFEYRRLKRHKLRKKLENCIWRASPSPPRGDREQSEPLDEPNGAMDPPAVEKEEAEEH